MAEGEAPALEAMLAGQIEPGDVVVNRFEGLGAGCAYGICSCQRRR